jgi:hypothetical protein
MEAESGLAKTGVRRNCAEDKAKGKRNFITPGQL